MSETELPDRETLIARLRDAGMSEFVDVLLTKPDCYDDKGRIQMGVLAGHLPGQNLNELLERARQVVLTFMEGDLQER